VSVVELLTRLRQRDIRVWCEAGQLRYSAPQGALTPELREQLIRSKAELLSFLESVKVSAPATTDLQPVPRSNPLPLSYAQQRLWLLTELQPDTNAYHIPGAIRLEGVLDVPALHEALNEIVRRHEILRTTFVKVDGNLVQQIEPATEHSLPVVDLTDAADREAEVRRHAAEEASRPFDLVRGPLLRTTLLRFEETDHVLLFTMHHIISDGWSLGILVRELTALYECFTQNLPSPLEDLPVQYADFAYWQREWLQGQVLEQQLGFWRKQLKDAPRVMELPLDHPRPKEQSFVGSSVPVNFSSELSHRLKELSQEHGGTLFSTLLAGFQLLLSRYTNSKDIVVGAGTAGRTHSKVESLIGFFVNTLVLRTDLSGDPSVGELLGRVREVCLQAYAHQDLPFEKLVEELQPERSLSHQPLFQVMFVLQNAPREALQLAGQRISLLKRESGTAKFDLIMSLVEGDDEISGVIEYRRELFEEETMVRLATHYEQLLQEMVADPGRRVSQLRMLSAAEEQQVVEEWNETGREYPQEVCIHELFAEQARRTPYAVAVIAEGEEVSYGELDRRANQVASRLQQLGVGPEVVVGICVERSVSMVVGLLGILKAGGAYLPLDAEYPRERLEYMIADARVSVLLTQSELRERLPEQVNAAVVYLDSEELWENAVPEPQSSVGSGNLAYLLYTSGSTGRPKAVAVTHRSAVALLSWAETVFEEEALDGVLFSTSINFDLSVFELFVPLSRGGKVIVAVNALQLGELTRREEVRLINTVPSAMRELVRSGRVPQSVRVVNLAGEALSRSLVEEIYGLEQVQEVNNLYGPTEDTTYSTWERVACDEAEAVRIGKPIANTCAYVLDGEQQVVPVGVRGELYLGGDGLARGYWGRAELTAERFVPDGVSGRSGERLYRTGDEVRYGADGRLEYFGRLDQQVKVRGYRIELGEVEEVLQRHESIRESVVVVRDEQLVGYVVAAEGVELEMSELRAYLGEQLPGYMIPAVLVQMAALPLTSNGKVDRKALPEPEQMAAVGEYVGPRTAVEELLAGIWSEVLGVERVGVHDNFFELGGHSLLATQVISRVRESFKVELPLRSLFEAPTLSEFSSQIEAGLGVEQDFGPAIERVRRDSQLPLSFAQQRLWFLQQMSPESCAYHLITALRVSGPLSVEVLERAVKEIVRRHEVLRTTFATLDGETRQIISPDGGIGLQLIDLRHEGAEEQEHRVREEVQREAHTPFNLSSGPLLRLTVLQQSESEHVLLLTMHHIISDGWSLGVLVNELGQLYGAYARGEESPLAELSIQYADYAIWQRERFQGEVQERQLEYWREQLRGAPAVLELPADRARPQVQSFRGNTAVFTLSEELSERLKEVSREQGATLFITLLAAFQTLMSRYGTDDVVVGSPIANRNRSEIEQLIGFFVNTLVLRARVKRDESFTELVREVREVCLGAYAHQDVPFEQLVEELQPERSLSYEPLFQVMFVLQNAPQETRAIEGLSFAPVEFESRSCRCDLTVSMSEVQGRLQGLVEYSTDLFEAATISRMMGHFTNLLESIAADPEQRVGELRMLSAGEERQIVTEWNETGREYRREACIHELFAEQARRRPDAVAVIAEGEQVSYGELDQRANQVANHLQSLGVGPEVVVGICVERSVAMVVGLLGILKAGGAYLPLDAEYPRERLEYMIADAGASVLLTQSELRERLPEQVNAQVVYVDSEEFGHGSVAEPQSSVNSGNLAYLLYTSGSTGRPKAVAVTHRSAVALLSWAETVFDEEALDGVLFSTSINFDLSVFELFVPLSRGGKVIVAANALQLPELAQREQVRLINTVPSAMRELVRSGSVPESVRVVNLAGEALSRSLVEEIYGLEQVQEVNNLYGPTEDTTYSTWERMAREEAGAVRIGRPIANTQAYVLDEEQQVVPVGVRGELYLGGDGLARGYWGRAELTAERFVPDGVSGRSGERLYRTGDEVRYGADGRLEYLGRLDQQVKVRGYRIELGEVEEVLQRHESIRECVVVVRDEQLVGYVVAAAELEMNELRAYLGAQLPGYMIPGVLVEMAALPLTSNGKVDRKALPGAELELKGRGEYEAPRTEVERVLAEIWAQVLGVERVGIHDNFFELGGDSILSFQSIARANQAGLQLSPKDLFGHQTVARLAAVAGRVEAVEAEQGLVMGPVSLTPIQHWFFEQELSEPHHFNQTLLLEIRESIEPELLGEAVQQIVLHHDALRLRFEHSASGWRQFHGAAAESLSFSAIDLSAVAESEQRAALEAEAAAVQASLNLSEGPLLRVVYFDLGAGRAGRLLLVCHHLVVDGVSWRILLADLQEAYRALVAGEAVQLPAKSSSFQQWSQALTEYAASGTVQEQLAYWLRAEQEQVQNIPRDYEGENRVHGTAVVVESLSREETEALLQEVPGVYHTQINEVLLSALALALGQWSKQNVVLVDMEGHGREPISERVDVTQTVGWFTTIYPVLLEVAGNRDQVGEVVKQVKEQVRSIPGQGLGYGVLRYLASDEVGKRLRELPQAEVSFNYLGQIDRILNEETLFGAASESSGNYRSESGNRQYLVEINAMIAGGRLQVSWSYSSQVHERERIAAVAAAYVQSLRRIIEHCASAEAGGYTPSDFPLAQLQNSELPAVVGAQRRGIEDVYPLSPMQEGLLFHSLYEPQGGLYVEQVQNRFRGSLDIKALRTAWERVQERHGILRSSFRWEGLRRPLQVVQEHAALTWAEQDWRGLSSADQTMKLEAFLSADRERGFEVTHAPLMRMMVVRLAESEWEFVWSFHHILLDGWCTSLLLQEVFNFYEGYRQGQVVELPRTRSYRDYIGWLQQQDLGAAESYWRKRLAGFRAPTQPGFETVESIEATPGYGERTLELSKEATSGLEMLARDRQVTLNTVVQGAWAVLLSRYSGECDVVYGVTVSGRPAELAGVEQMVGLFINTLPLRVQVESGVELGTWLQQLQTEQAEMRQYEYSPLVEVQGWSEVERGVGLFETLLAFENYPVTAVTGEQSGSEAAVKYEQKWAMERTNYPLTMLVGPGERLMLKAPYDKQRYSAETIERVLVHLEQILVSMTAGGQQRVGELRMLSAAEERQIVTEWNETEREYPWEVCIHELFVEQARRTPEGIAVIAEGEQVSYRELDQRANQVANHLQSLGVGPEVVVGICVERSVAMVVGLLGILKAGGAYLPLDAGYPRERLEYMIADAGASALLTQRELRERLPEQVSAEVLYLESDALLESSVEEPQSNVSSGNLAYLLYTSGSTGRPKAVAIEHRSAVALLSWAETVFDKESLDGMLASTSINFDISVFELFLPLSRGGKVIVAANALQLPELAQREQVRLINTVPSAMRELVRSGSVPESVRVVNLAGEALSRSLVEEIYGLEQVQEVNNLYGPTEDTTYSTWEKVARGEAVRIGRPIANTQAYVLDEKQQVVPVGVRGELFLGGEGLARGYWGRAELTAERFVPNPYSTRAGARLYRTGDEVRYGADGRLEYLGRLDQQVKVRGYRIELGEVEEVLQRHESIQESVVVVRDEQLVGYVVAGEGVELDVNELRAYLGEQLPGYMIPGVLVGLAALPLNANGKIDRKALPEPEEMERPAEYVGARTAVEELVAGIWSEVLGVERVGVENNFFELGGHSLMATRVISRVRESLQVELPIGSLFEAATLRQFCSQIEGALGGGQSEFAPAIERVDRASELPLSFAQQRLWFLHQLDPLSPAYHIPAAIQLCGHLDLAALERSFAEIIRRHEGLRTVFPMRDGRAVQQILPAGPWRLKVIDLSEYEAAEREREVQRRATAEAAELFDLSTGPLFRVKVLRLSESEHVLLMTMHHIVSDAWSLGVLVQEMGQLYERFLAHDESHLPELPVQYADYAVWQRQWLSGELLDEQLGYWRRQLADALPAAPLITDHPRFEITTHNGAVESVIIPADLTRKLRALSAREAVTLFMTLLTGLKILLYRYTANEDIIIGSPIANRNRKETEGLIGFFANLLIYRTSFAGAPTFRQLLRRIREQALAAYAHQDLPFEKLVDELQPEREPGNKPLVQVVFSLQNALVQSSKLSDLSLRILDLNPGTAMFDLAFVLTDTSQELQVKLNYNADLFERETITRMLDHFKNILQQVVEEPDIWVMEISLLSPEESSAFATPTHLLQTYKSEQFDFQ
jgi:amino acid adenylation domain-containing protein/non-ribosomal peptide synthase protein (TIGR01720 family)